jgi:hypothetical protein
MLPIVDQTVGCGCIGTTSSSPLFCIISYNIEVHNIMGIHLIHNFFIVIEQINKDEEITILVDDIICNKDK